MKGAAEIEGEQAAVPLQGNDCLVVHEQVRWGPFSGMELPLGLLDKPNPWSRRKQFQSSEETILFLRVQHAKSLLALKSYCFYMERFPVPGQTPLP